MPDLIVIIGPPASGKAAVGTELAKLTGFRFCHNHMTAEAAGALFGWDNELYREAATEVRLLLLSKALAQKGAPSVIITFLWAFDLDTDNLFMAQLVAMAKQNNGEVYFVELLASQEARIAREGSPLRVSLKPSKRDVGKARELHAQADAKHQMNSAGDFPYPEHHVIIDTEVHDAAAAAQQVVDAFGFRGAGPG
jgi:hypothetical protein